MAAHLLDCWWLVLPSVRGLGAGWAWPAALPVLALVVLAAAVLAAVTPREKVHA
jgi:hypothetical protein